MHRGTSASTSVYILTKTFAATSCGHWKHCCSKVFHPPLVVFPFNPEFSVIVQVHLQSLCHVGICFQLFASFMPWTFPFTTTPGVPHANESQSSHLLQCQNRIDMAGHYAIAGVVKRTRREQKVLLLCFQRLCPCLIIIDVLNFHVLVCLLVIDVLHEVAPRELGLSPRHGLASHVVLNDTFIRALTIHLGELELVATDNSQLLDARPCCQAFFLAPYGDAVLCSDHPYGLVPSDTGPNGKVVVAPGEHGVDHLGDPAVDARVAAELLGKRFLQEGHPHLPIVQVRVGDIRRGSV
mmetsp:Transcript_37301/g.89204  ORF Transcript_37301/g.89204 Transcript_37301/m.89204 type:complete len:295 (+) Transcript_37301:56-940(+)